MATNDTPKKGVGKRGGSVDEAAAFLFYCTNKDGGRQRSIADVAKKFGVSCNTMEKMAKKHEWVVKRKKAGEALVVEIVRTMGEIVKEKNTEHLTQFQELAAFGKEILEGQARLYRDLIKNGYPEDVPKSKKGKASRRKPAFSAFTANIGAQMLVDGIKGQRVALGLPTDVTKSMAFNMNLNETLPNDELERMQGFLDRNHNKRLLEQNNDTDTTKQ